MTRKVDFMKTASAGAKAKGSARHLRRANERELQKLKKKYPAEYDAAQKKIRERYGE
jgi:hypothetical protein